MEVELIHFLPIFYELEGDGEKGKGEKELKICLERRWMVAM